MKTFRKIQKYYDVGADGGEGTTPEKVDDIIIDEGKEEPEPKVEKEEVESDRIKELAELVANSEKQIAELKAKLEEEKLTEEIELISKLIKISNFRSPNDNSLLLGRKVFLAWRWKLCLYAARGRFSAAFGWGTS